MIRTIAPPGGMIAACGFLLWQTADMTSAYAASALFGPAFFPRLVLGGLILVSLLQIVDAVRRHRAGTVPGGAAAGRPDVAGFLVALAATALYVVAMRFVGFLPATLVFQAALFALVFGMRDRRGLVYLPALLTALYYVIFLRLLELPLPQGRGVFRELSRFLYY
ncbi:tripartite tricarboxylate transporter TctB family protein [Aquibium sp. A9E412]|uniref:tripartite tricarboxylate transporter TctB family protein n=1 Tax=Aquibium sp. A9E412 TaxID=2976767 RepID=UPI0025B0309B|nr:tripartite tricarboxylate transporter TctB family protein [Aquibium sp. A9E412]MDN2565594.1 tripartite tricarboxylate transporter TctB family protein [Aquibium sp. A9E412]